MKMYLTLDILIEDEGTIAMVTPLTPRARVWTKVWFSTHPGISETQRFGASFVLDHKLVGDFVEALFDSDFNFQYSIRGEQRAN